MNELLERITVTKAELDRLRPLSSAAVAQLQKHYDVELTYMSNAIEGNTLTLRETAEVIEHGITVGGKSLVDHLEAVDHYDAVQWMRAQAAASTLLTEGTICELHRRIVARSRPDIAGTYSRLPRRIAGLAVVFPDPAKIPSLMANLGEWIAEAPGGAERGVRGPFPSDGHSPVRGRQRAHGAPPHEPDAGQGPLSTGGDPSRGSQRRISMHSNEAPSPTICSRSDASCTND